MENTTRCKFRCTEVTKQEHWDKSKSDFLYRAKFTAVHDGSDENKSFFDATPSGLLEIAVYKQDVFVPGKEYYLDLSLATPA